MKFRPFRYVHGRAVVLSVLVALALHGAPSDTSSDKQLDALFAEVKEAEQAQDLLRLRKAYQQLAELLPEDATIQRGLGLACYLAGDYEAAITPLALAARLQDDLPGARLYLGISYYRTNRFAEALDPLERSPELASGDPSARYWQGATYRALGRLPEAIEFLARARDGAPQNLDTVRMLTRAHSEYSAQLLRRLLAAAPESAPAKLLRAEELAMDGVYEAALREVDAALKVAPDLIGAHFAKGQILWSQERYREGANEFRRELERDPFSGGAHFRLGGYLLDSGQDGRALWHLRQAERYSVESDQLEPLMRRAVSAGVSPEPPPAIDEPWVPSGGDSLPDARVAFRQGQSEASARMLERILSAQPDSVQARLLLARSQFVNGRTDSAVQHLSEILAARPDEPEALYLLGKTHEALASRSAERLFELSPEGAGVRLLRGEAFERGPKNDFESALAEFRMAETLNPNEPGVQHAIGRVLYKMNRYDEAVPHLQAVLSQNRSHAAAYFLLGRIQLRQGDREAAIKSLQAAIKARPGLAAAKRDLAQALVLAGRADEGIALYEQLAKRGVSDSSLHALMAVAYRKAGNLAKAKEHAEHARRLGSAQHRPKQPN